MAYGSDITEAIPYGLSNPISSLYSATGVNYDMALNGLPFFIAASDDSPYRRVTAKYRKEQYDQTREAGEQSLTGWWFRSQSTFHLGAGIKYFEPAQDESLRFQYTESKGVEVFTRGQVTLLNITASFYSGAAPAQLIGVNDGTNDCIVFTDGTAINKQASSSGSPTAYVQTGTASTIFSVTTNGKQYFFINGTHVHRGNIAGATSDIELYSATSTTRGTIRFVKQRLIAAIGNAIYELDTTKSYSATINNAAVTTGTVTLTTSAAHNLIVGDTVSVIDLPAPFTAYNVSATVTAVGSSTTFSYVVGSATVTTAATTGKFLKTTLPTALFTHPNTSWVWSSIAEGPSAIYISGYDPNGTSSSVFKIELDVTITNSLGFPTLETPTVIIDLPDGESINDFDVYLGTYAVLATNKGFRVGVSDATGNIQYGPLLFDQAACNSIAFRDHFAYLATIIDGEAGLVRVDLSTTVTANSLVFPWAWDLVASGITTKSDQVAFFGNTDRAAFTSGNVIYAESTTDKVASGYLQTGYIRYNTLENKLFKLLNPRIDTADGGVTIQSVDYAGVEYNLGTFNQDDPVTEIGVPYPATAQEYLAFKFTLSRSSTTTEGPLFTGYQLKSLPAVPRQRIIQYPLFCYDHESDNVGVEVGYEGSAYDRLSQLEAVENLGDTIRVQDFRTGESYIGLIEELDFINKTPSDKRFSGYGGMLIATIRLI
jgi:hypothetical protein